MVWGSRAHAGSGVCGQKGSCVALFPALPSLYSSVRVAPD